MLPAARSRLTTKESTRRSEAIRAQLRAGAWVYLGHHGKSRKHTSRPTQVVAILPYRSSQLCVATHDAYPPAVAIGPARSFVRVLHLPLAGEAITEVFCSAAPLGSIRVDARGSLRFLNLAYRHEQQMRLDLDAPKRTEAYAHAWHDAIGRLHGPVEDLPLVAGRDEILRTAGDQLYRIEPGPTAGQRSLLDLDASVATGRKVRMPIYALRRTADNTYAFVTDNGVLSIGPVVEHVMADPVRPRPLELDARALEAAVAADRNTGPALH
jgi:hypothetical protein